MNLIPSNVNPQPSNTKTSSPTSANTTMNNASLNNISLSSTSLSNASTGSPSFHPKQGQIIAGEVIDIKRNEVTILLKDQETITATLLQPAELKIGEQASFQVKSVSSNTINLQLLTKSIPASIQLTIKSALEAASLPITDKNQEIVQELLNHNMSINKQSVQNLFRQSLLYKEASIPSLVLMAKHHIPMNDANVKQFENYRNYEHRIVKEIDSLSNTFPTLIEGLNQVHSLHEINNFHNQFLDILLSSEGNMGGSNNSTLVLSTNSKQELLNLLSSYSLSDQLQSDIANGKANLFDVVTVLNQNNELAVQEDEYNLERLMTMEEVDPSKLPLKQDAFNTPLVDDILRQYQNYQQDQGQLGSFLSKQDRVTLLSDLRNLSLPEHAKELILVGKITTSETLSLIKSYLPMANESTTIDILSSNVYKTLIKEQLLAEWTFTPNSLTKKEAVPKLYDKMYEQLSKLEELTSKMTTAQDSLHNEMSLHKSSSDISNLKQNLDFMKTLNELFTYVQLPLRFKDKTIHSELYVYTNQKELKKNKDQISVLLHLDMDYLGSMDIHVNLNHNQITSRFYLETEESVNLVKDHIESLENALNQKGYLFNSEIVKKEREIDIVEDFIEKESQMSSLKRFSFDIRA